MKVQWKGKQYPDVEPNAGEIRQAERLVGEDLDSWSRLTASMVAIFVAVRRVDADAITWDELEALPVDKLLDCYVDEPKRAGRAPLDRKPKAASRPSSGRGTRRAAAGSSTSGSTSTGATS